jgi:hypothetical protein
LKNAFWISFTIAWTVLVWGLSSRPETSISVEGQREPNEMKAELPDVGAVPLELLVHLADDDAPERLIDEERSDDSERHDRQHAIPLKRSHRRPPRPLCDAIESPTSVLQGICLEGRPRESRHSDEPIGRQNGGAASH